MIMASISEIISGLAAQSKSDKKRGIKRDFNYFSSIRDDENFNLIIMTVLEGTKENLEDLLRVLRENLTENEVKALLEDKESELGLSALLCAVNEEKEDMVEFLLEQGADVNARGKTGITALQIAQARKNDDIADALLKVMLKGEELPKKMHFVWLGGPITEQYLQSIGKLSSLATANGFEVNIWVDNEKNITAPLEKMLRERNMPDVEIPAEVFGIKVRNINELQEEMKNDPFYQQGNRLKQFNSYVNREMIGFRNLASASDLLRYEILRQEGGYYFDCDTEFRLTGKEDVAPDSPPLGIVTNTEFSFTKKTGKIELKTATNDILGVVPHHPVIENVINQSMKNYQEFDKKLTKDEKAILDQTKTLTGFNPQEHSTKMDVKRYPYGNEISQEHILFSVVPNKRNLSITAAGPAAFLEVMKDFCKKNVSSLEVMEASTIKQGKQFKVADIRVVSHSDKTWLKKPKDTRYFDTSSLPKGKLFQPSKADKSVNNNNNLNDPNKKMRK
ncbi:MAG: hypothetical protein EPO11_07555 [Gammaproteobacteria bacterium]|nr:MAG: hypothetical protein EPO11_07555 [Gammaproteobacteria bacterium]